MSGSIIPIPAHLRQYVTYLRNCGPVVSYAQFDDDYAPAGPLIRGQMKRAGLVECDDRLEAFALELGVEP